MDALFIKMLREMSLSLCYLLAAAIMIALSPVFYIARSVTLISVKLIRRRHDSVHR